MAVDFGIFLDPLKFGDAVLGLGNPLSTPLLNVAYLWGAHFSASKDCAKYTPAILALSIRTAPESLASVHPHKVLHWIQTEVLLASYFFAEARILEAKYHTNAALSLALSSGLNKIRTSAPRGEADVLPPPADAKEEGERINGLWTVLTLNIALAAADSSPSSISYDASGTRIDAPWPLELENYNEVCVSLWSSLRLR